MVYMATASLPAFAGVSVAFMRRGLPDGRCNLARGSLRNVSVAFMRRGLPDVRRKKNGLTVMSLFQSPSCGEVFLTSSSVRSQFWLCTFQSPSCGEVFLTMCEYRVTLPVSLFQSPSCGEVFLTESEVALG